MLNFENHNALVNEFVVQRRQCVRGQQVQWCRFFADLNGKCYLGLEKVKSVRLLKCNLIKWKTFKATSVPDTTGVQILRNFHNRYTMDVANCCSRLPFFTSKWKRIQFIELLILSNTIQQLIWSMRVFHSAKLCVQNFNIRVKLREKIGFRS